ncbi:RAI1-domain-containing protein [Armillaria solidipes]|uniref:Decapping nuclease n=1 Tax=Armillaria solidipes TaxID=1076256 RepID=A0A2H3CGF2_9AGAR|nr:RAI1-domain-containing protein [Armillaria solidipes]
MSKRKASELLCESEISRGTKSRRLEDGNSISYPDLTLSHAKAPTPFQKPMPIISFSYTPSRTLEFNDLALRYFVDPPIGAQLSYGYDKWIRRPEEKGRIDGLLKALSRVKSNGKVALDDVAVVSWRGVMTRILTAPYEDRDGWELNVMCINGTMYFEEHISNQKLSEKENMEPRHRKQSYFGYAFESYGTSATPRRPSPKPGSKDPPGWGGDVDTNVQWCSVVRTKLGNNRLIIGGEVDCVRDRYTGTTDSFVELKTSLTIRGPHDEAKFEKKLLKFYFQSFLLGVPEITVGFRTPSGEVTTVQSFDTTKIPRLVRGKAGSWDPSICLNWGEEILTFLKKILQGSDADKASVWRVKFVPKEGVTIVKLTDNLVDEVVNGEERVGFLPKWYWDEMETVATVAQSTSGSVAGWQI